VLGYCFKEDSFACQFEATFVFDDFSNFLSLAMTTSFLLVSGSALTENQIVGSSWQKEHKNAMLFSKICFKN